MLSAILVLFLIIVNQGTSLKTALSKTSSVPFAESLVNSFGLAAGGTIDVNYNVMGTDGSIPYDSMVTLLILTERQRIGWYLNLYTAITPDESALCTRPALFRQHLYGNGSVAYTAESAEKFTLVTLQCRNSAVHSTNVHMDAILVNPQPVGDGQSHLSIQNVMIPRVLGGEILLYSLMLVGLVGQCYFAKPYVRRIHYWFGATLLSIILALFMEYGENVRYNATGVNSTAFKMVVKLFGHIAVTAQLTTMMFLSLGWSIARYTVSDMENKAVGLFVTGYLLCGLISSTCVEDTMTCEVLDLGTYIVKSLVFLGIVVALNFTCVQLRAMLIHSTFVPGVTLQYARSKQYQMLRIVFILFVLTPTAFQIVENVVFSWKESWLTVAFTDLINVMMVFHIGATFGPVNDLFMTRAFNPQPATAS